MIRRNLCVFLPWVPEDSGNGRVGKRATAGLFPRPPPTLPPDTKKPESTDSGYNIAVFTMDTYHKKRKQPAWGVGEGDPGRLHFRSARVCRKLWAAGLQISF